jgi:hypothetical protein
MVPELMGQVDDSHSSYYYSFVANRNDGNNAACGCVLYIHFVPQPTVARMTGTTVTIRHPSQRLPIPKPFSNAENVSHRIALQPETAENSNSQATSQAYHEA